MSQMPKQFDKEHETRKKILWEIENTDWDRIEYYKIFEKIKFWQEELKYIKSKNKKDYCAGNK